MKIEQLTIDDQIVTSPPYQSLDPGGNIYSKIDYFTAIFTDCSMFDVLSWIQCEDLISDLCSTFYEAKYRFDEPFNFNYESIHLSTAELGFYRQDVNEDLFDLVCKSIKLEISGSGLDFLRDRGILIDHLVTTSPALPEGASYHVTRVDYAFDLINYCPQFLDELIDHIQYHKLPSERVPVNGLRGGIKARMVLGGQKTIYLGSAQSERMLRVYDKRMQHVDLSSGLYTKSNPYNNPDSWIRIEWQLRNGFAFGSIIDSELDHKKIFKAIFDFYAFTDGSNKNVEGHGREVVDFWLRLFDWEHVESHFIQNAKYVSPITLPEKITNYYEKIAAFNVMLLYSWLGPLQFEKINQEYLNKLYDVDPKSYRRLLSSISKLNQCSEIIKEANTMVGIYEEKGIIKFKLFPDELLPYVEAYYSGLLPPLPASVLYELKVLKMGGDPS